MFHSTTRTVRWLPMFLVLLTACSAPASNLNVTVLHPGESSEMEEELQ
jgi:hypothetical protein